MILNLQRCGFVLTDSSSFIGGIESWSEDSACLDKASSSNSSLNL